MFLIVYQNRILLIYTSYLYNTSLSEIFFHLHQGDSTASPGLTLAASIFQVMETKEILFLNSAIEFRSIREI